MPPAVVERGSEAVRSVPLLIRIVQRGRGGNHRAQPGDNLSAVQLQRSSIEGGLEAAPLHTSTTAGRLAILLTFGVAAAAPDAEWPKAEACAATPMCGTGARRALPPTEVLLKNGAIAAPFSSPDHHVANAQELLRDKRHQVVVLLRVQGPVADRILLIADQVPVTQVEQVAQQPWPDHRAHAVFQFNF